MDLIIQYIQFWKNNISIQKDCYKHIGSAVKFYNYCLFYPIINSWFKISTLVGIKTWKYLETNNILIKDEGTNCPKFNTRQHPLLTILVKVLFSWEGGTISHPIPNYFYSKFTKKIDFNPIENSIHSKFIYFDYETKNFNGLKDGLPDYNKGRMREYLLLTFPGFQVIYLIKNLILNTIGIFKALLGIAFEIFIKFYVKNWLKRLDKENKLDYEHLFLKRINSSIGALNNKDKFGSSRFRGSNVHFERVLQIVKFLYQFKIILYKDKDILNKLQEKDSNFLMIFFVNCPTVKKMKDDWKLIKSNISKNTLNKLDDIVVSHFIREDKYYIESYKRNKNYFSSYLHMLNEFKDSSISGTIDFIAYGEFRRLFSFLILELGRIKVKYLSTENKKQGKVVNFLKQESKRGAQVNLKKILILNSLIDKLWGKGNNYNFYETQKTKVINKKVGTKVLLLIFLSKVIDFLASEKGTKELDEMVFEKTKGDSDSLEIRYEKELNSLSIFKHINLETLEFNKIDLNKTKAFKDIDSKENIGRKLETLSLIEIAALFKDWEKEMMNTQLLKKDILIKAKVAPIENANIALDNEVYKCELLNSKNKFIKEGFEMHNCVASYFEDCDKGDSVIYSILNEKNLKERSTLEVKKEDSYFKVIQHSTYCNQPISNSLKEIEVKLLDYLNNKEIILGV